MRLDSKAKNPPHAIYAASQLILLLNLIERTCTQSYFHEAQTKLVPQSQSKLLHRKFQVHGFQAN